MFTFDNVFDHTQENALIINYKLLEERHHKRVTNDVNSTLEEEYIHNSFNAYKTIVGDNSYRENIIKNMIKNTPIYSSNPTILSKYYFPEYGYTGQSDPSWHSTNLELFKISCYQTSVSHNNNSQYIKNTNWYRGLVKYLNKTIKNAVKLNKTSIHTIVSSPGGVGQVSHYLAVIIQLPENRNKTPIIYTFDPAGGIWKEGISVVFGIEEYCKDKHYSSVNLIPVCIWQTSYKDTWCQTWTLLFQYLVIEQDTSPILLARENSHTTQRRTQLIQFIRKSIPFVKVLLNIEYNVGLTKIINEDSREYNRFVKELEYELKKPYSEEKIIDIQDIYDDLYYSDTSITRSKQLRDNLSENAILLCANFQDFFPN
jgi:hypothetical protein